MFTSPTARVNNNLHLHRLFHILGAIWRHSTHYMCLTTTITSSQLILEAIIIVSQQELKLIDLKFKVKNFTTLGTEHIDKGADAQSSNTEIWQTTVIN